MHDFRYISVFAFGCVFYTVMVALLELPAYYEANFVSGKVVYFNIGWHSLQALSVGIFAFTVHCQLVPIFNELINPTTRRSSKVITRTTFTMATVYVTCGMAGYFATFDKTPALMLERSRIDGKGITTAMLFANLAMILLMFVHIPVNYVAARGLIILMRYKTEKFSFKQNFTITFMFICLLVTVAIVFPDIIKVLSILGGLCSPIIAFIIPTYCYVNLREESWKNWKSLGSILLCVTLSACGFTSVILTVF